MTGDGPSRPAVSGVQLDSVPRAIAEIAAGKPVVVVDDADRENEGDLIFAASKATPELLAFTIRHTSGVICVPMPGEDLDRLQLPLMTAQNKERMRTAFTVSVDARDGVTTGISAADRAACCAGRGTPRRRSTSSFWPGCPPPECWPKWSTTTGRWPGCRRCAPSPTRTGWR